MREMMDIAKSGGRYLLVVPNSQQLFLRLQEAFGEYGGDIGWRFLPAYCRIEHASGGFIVAMTADAVLRGRHRGLDLTHSNSTSKHVLPYLRGESP